MFYTNFTNSPMFHYFIFTIPICWIQINISSVTSGLMESTHIHNIHLSLLSHACHFNLWFYIFLRKYILNVYLKNITLLLELVLMGPVNWFWIDLVTIVIIERMWSVGWANSFNLYYVRIISSIYTNTYHIFKL